MRFFLQIKNLHVSFSLSVLDISILGVVYSPFNLYNGGMAKEKKPLTKTQHIERNATVLNLVARLLVCAFLLGVIIYSLPM